MEMSIMRLTVVIISAVLIVILLTYTPLTVFKGIKFSEVDNVFEQSSSVSGAAVRISLDIAFDGWNATINGIEDIKLSLNSPAHLAMLIESSPVLNMSIERIEVYGAEVTIRGLHYGEHKLLLLDITPVQRIKLFYISRYQPMLDINMRDPIEWHMKSTEKYFYLPPEAFMPIPKLKGNFTVTAKVISYPPAYTLAGIIKIAERKYRPFLPEKSSGGEKLYILLGRWGVYRKTVKIDGRNVKVIALTDEGNVTNELAKIIEVYSSYLTPMMS
ncbi:hypothetical protein [Thermococcus sp.]